MRSVGTEVENKLKVNYETYGRIEKDLSFPCECGGIEEVIGIHLRSRYVTTRCSKCGKLNAIDYYRCRKCGTPYPSESELFNQDNFLCFECEELRENHGAKKDGVNTKAART